MGYFREGDVVIAPVVFEDRRSTKTRPAIVIAAGDNGSLHICPLSSHPPADAPGIPVSLGDFSEGGLDLFAESYVLTSRMRIIRNCEVIAKRGRLTPEAVATIREQIPASLRPEITRNKNTRCRDP